VNELPRDESFDGMFHQLYPRAVRLARRILGDTAAAEDVAAEALARAFASWPKVRELPYRDAWVLRVTSNLAIDAARRHQPRVVATEPIDLEETTAVRVALVAALRALPRRQRDVIALRYLAGLSEAEIAASLDIALGTVKTHIHRGVAGLRRRLGDTFQEDTLAG